MKNLICTAFSFKEGYNTSTQTGKEADLSTTTTYLKNIFVTLTSAKLHNKEDDVVLYVNEPISDEWSRRLYEQGVEVKVCPFDTFVISKEYIWALAYYKLCVLNAVVAKNKETKEYDHILLMDTDTFTTRSYDELWKEADFGVLMYQVGHSFNHSDRQIIRADYEKFYPTESKEKAIIHFGGEFVAGNQKDLEIFVDTCKKVFEKMTSNSETKMHERAGDETIWSVAAALTSIPVIHAGAYIYRFWTGDFYLTSTVTVSNPVCIWHIPNEKEAGFIRLYDYYRKNKHFPSVEKSSRIFGILKAKRPKDLGCFMFKVKRKLWK